MYLVNIPCGRMVVTKIEERTLYWPLINYLSSIGIEAQEEPKIIRKRPDIVFQLDSTSFVVEIKMGKPEVGLKAVAQAYDYARKLKTQNIIILVYPEKFRNVPITDPTILERVALTEKIHALVLTENWTEKLIIEPTNLFDKLKEKIIKKQKKVDLKTTIDQIESYVRELNSVVRYIKTDELVGEVVNKLDLFSAIGEIKDRKTAKRQVGNLATYLLFNQILFYQIYKKKSRADSLSELTEIKKLQDLQKNFDEITAIDYQSIYRVNILGRMPHKRIFIETLNKVIKATKLLRAEHIRHDLLGRLFHDLIPFEVRKILAAFYTHPVGAEILSGLSIDSYDDTVMDPACGSGTLLVASYRRKEDLYQKLHGYKHLRKMHRDFIEKELTGIDIMPFAAHLSTINLTVQNIEQTTNKVRMATLDSLELADLLKTSYFKRKGVKISPYTTSIQLTLRELTAPKKVKKKGSVSPEGEGSEFLIHPVDVVIMNPPYSDRKNMPKDYIKKLSSYRRLESICGSSVNLWGYFLALADIVLKERGKIAAVLPIDFARGSSSKKIREYILKNYQIKYIIKPVKDLAFSEGAKFKDILLIAEKTKPNKNYETKVIFFKKSKDEIKLEELNDVVNRIKNAEPDEFFDIIKVTFEQLVKYSDNLMPLIGGSSREARKTLWDFTTALEDLAESKIIPFEKLKTKRGFETSPTGLSDLVLVTRKVGNERIRRANLLIEEENNNYLKIRQKELPHKIKISKSQVSECLRTLTNLDTFDITNSLDYLILSEYPKFDIVFQLSRFKGQPKDVFQKSNKELKRVGQCHLAIAEKVNMSSPNTHFVAFYSEKKFSPTEMFYMAFENKEELKMQTLILNSIFGLSQMLLYKSEGQGSMIKMRKAGWCKVKLFDTKNLSLNDKKKLLKLFKKLKSVKFPSIINQLESRFWARTELDKMILKMLGFSDGEVNQWLPKIYDELVNELKTMKSQ